MKEVRAEQTQDAEQLPLKELLGLAQREKIDLTSLALHPLLCVHLERTACHFERLIELLWMMMQLLLLKSRWLLRVPEEKEAAGEGVSSSVSQQLFELQEEIWKLAETLTQRAHLQEGRFPRPPRAQELVVEKPSPLESVSLNDLQLLLTTLLTREKEKKRDSATPLKYCHVLDPWPVSAQISRLQQCLEHEVSVSLSNVCDFASCREERIALFLALLEMIKNQQVRVVKESGSEMIMIRSIP